MTRYEITIQRTQGKNKGLSVIYAKKNLSAILDIAKKKQYSKEIKLKLNPMKLNQKTFVN